MRGTGDDFDQLAETLNQMLARIEDSVFSVSRHSDSIAHELRASAGPPARRPGGAGEGRAGRSRAGPPWRRTPWRRPSGLQSTFDALLRIARIETGRHAPALRSLDLAVLLDDAVDLYQAGAEAKGQTLSCDDRAAAADARRPRPVVPGGLEPPRQRHQICAGRRPCRAWRRAAPAHPSRWTSATTAPASPPSTIPHLTERFFRAPNAPEPAPASAWG